MMKFKIIPLLLLGLTLQACQPKEKQKNNPVVSETKAENSETNKLTDFTMKDPTGKDISVLSEVKKNKITIIDFWASWCGPCIAMMPELVQLYDEEKDKGLGIVGVSLDNDEANWKEAISTLNLKWTHVSDLKGWENEAARMYGVNAIPFTMVVAQDGTILSTGLRGGELITFVKDYLK